MSYIWHYGATAAPPPTGTTSDQWRIQINAIEVVGNWPTIKEIEMRATSGGADQCVGGTATASSFNDPPGGLIYTAANAFDDSVTDSSVWQASGATLPAWIAYQFTSTVAVTEVSIMAWTSPNDSPKDFDIQYFDGTDWVTSWSVTGEPAWASDEVRVFTKP